MTQSVIKSKHFDSAGYVLCYVVDRGFVYEHIIISEIVLDRRLPPEVEIHHIDKNKSNNKNSNLVICPNREYHRLLHRRAEALESCGNASYRKCIYCKEWDDPNTLSQHSKGSYTHKKCHNKYKVGRRARTKSMTYKSP